MLRDRTEQTEQVLGLLRVKFEVVVRIMTTSLIDDRHAVLRDGGSGSFPLKRVLSLVV
jgi:hypothetical protein